MRMMYEVIGNQCDENGNEVLKVCFPTLLAVLQQAAVQV